LNERRKSSRSAYSGRIAADLPALPLRLTSSGLITVASAISGLARSIRLIGYSYDEADDAQKAYAQEKITRGVKHIADLWEALIESK
jgi:hypothetical protein